MDRRSYRSYKSDRYKFSKPHNLMIFSFDKSTLSKLNYIRLFIIVLVVLIVTGSITAGFIINRKKQVKKTEAVVTTVEKTEESILLKVVNKNNPLEKSFVPSLENYNDLLVNTLAVNPLIEIISAAQKDNVDLKVELAYVSYEEQQRKYNQKYNDLLNSGNYTKVTAEAKAQTTTPKGGRSEYQTGLLFKFTTNQEHKQFQDTQAFRWLEKYCIEYGFVVRYTQDKEGITMMKGDSSVYRYVGKENAKFMRTLNMCLDEYLSYISARE